MPRKRNYTFNYEALKAGNDDIQMRSDWLFPLCTGEERLKGGDGKKLHPTQKPEALLARIILAASRPDDLVLDPFSGTGTTGAVARRLRRRFIGIEREAEYAAAAEERIAAVEPMAEPALASFMTAREAPRVPFAALVERGLVAPGIKLVDAKRRHQALVRADGALALGEAVGSIHRIGALAQGLEACNGWTFWHVETPQGLTVIDACARACARRWAWSSSRARAVARMSASDIRDRRFNQIAFPHIASRISLRSCGLLVERMRHDLAHEARQRFAAKL